MVKKMSVPKLKVYYIDFDADSTQQNVANGNNLPGFHVNNVINAINAGLKVAPKAPQVALAIPAAYLVGIGAANLIRLVREESFFIIKNEEELSQFKNAYNNDWIIHNKALKTRQYYIQHPKKSKSNVLIEAQSFYQYIEEEMCHEMMDYVQRHCPAKSFFFYREESHEKDGNANAKRNMANFHANLKQHKNKSTLLSVQGAKGVLKPSTVEEYIWLEDTIKLGIRALEDGSGSFEKSFISDETFGLTAKEAKTLGLDMKGHKKFKYTLKVEC